MNPNSFKVMLIFLISAVLVFPLDADSDDCSTELMVRRNTTFTVIVGKELRIKCPVKFCNIPPPTIFWYKDEENYVRVSVSNNKGHIKTEWKRTKELEGIFYLVFKNILRSDSGWYHCETGPSVSHMIFINVNNNAELTTAGSQQPTTSENSTAQYGSSHVTYRVAGVMMFSIVVAALCVKSKVQCKGGRRNKAEQSAAHVYENDL